MPPRIRGTVSATGGVIILAIDIAANQDINTTEIYLERATNSGFSSATPLYSGVNSPIYMDIGDALPNYLDFATTYYYRVTDPTGQGVTPGITPSPTLQVFSNYLDKTLFRLFSAGFSALAVPQGYNKIRVLQSMPLSMGSEGVKFPFVVMNLDLEQQDDIQIGEAINTGDSAINTIPLIVFRRYSIHILSHEALERDFYKDSTISIFYNIMPVLNTIGNAVSVDLQAAQSQVSDGNRMPGFYEAKIMLNITGQFNVASENNNLQTIDTISAAVTSSGVTDLIRIT